MAIIEVTPEMMNIIANDLGKKIEEWDIAVKTIYDMQAELDGVFEGAARESLKAMMERDRPSYNALSELLVVYKNEIVKAAADFAAADQQGADLFK